MPSNSQTALLSAFGHTVRRLRVARGWSQEDFADRIGIHRTYVGAVERGEQNICLLNIARVAAALDLPLGVLLGEVDHEPH